MSLLAMAGGVLMYSQRQFLFDFHDNYLMGIEGKTLFDKLMAALTRIARRITVILENGSLQRYVALLFISALVAGAAAFWPEGRLTGSLPTQPLSADGVVGGFVLAIAAIGTVLLHRQRLIALIPLSVVGLFCALVFTQFAGPDLALTQLAVEFGTTMLLLLALYFLPQSTPADGSITRRLRDAAIGLLAGLGVAALTWAVLTRPYSSIAEYFLENSVAGGGGTNVVNVILVDFRGFDTLGEITVLAIAALGIVAMLSGLRLRAPVADDAGRPWTSDLHPLILRVIARLLLPLALLTSVYLFLRGHNLPGGGFVAGLVTGVALVLQFMASGIRWTEERVGSDFRPTLALGLLFATLTGLASWLFGYPFLTSAHTHVHWPVIGGFELASALAFDLGVYLTVVGIILIILTNLSRLGEASRTALPAPAAVNPREDTA
jgi:multicomponent K+:H+ antiporter subunit A